MAFGLETLGMGAGAGQGLEQLLAERRADELMSQRGLETLANMQNTRAFRESELEQRRQAAQAMNESRQEAARLRGEMNVDKQVQNMMPSDIIPIERYHQLQQAGGVGFPSSRFQPIGETAPVPPDFQGPLPEGETREGHPSGMRFLGLPGQLRSQQLADAQQAEREARIQRLTEQAGEAQQRLGLEGTAQELRSRLAGQAADLALQRLQAEIERNQANAAKTPTLFFTDAQGNSHAGTVVNGKFQEIPLPTGYEPTRPTTPGFSGWLKRLLGGGSIGASSDPTDPNWGKQK
jgi:hypothetical protein